MPSNISFMDDSNVDVLIKAALKKLDREDRLDEAVSATGIAGGKDSLREIMHTKGALSVMDRGMLSLHLLGLGMGNR